MTQQLEQAVARGAAWLDERRPGWHYEIDVASLDLSDPSRCVLGQIGAAILEEHGLYPNAVTGFGALTTWEVNWADGDAYRNEHIACIRTALNVGLSGVVLEDEEWFGFDRFNRGVFWGDLDDAWIRVIKERVSDGIDWSALAGAWDDA